MSCASVGWLHHSVWSLFIFSFKLKISFDLFLSLVKLILQKSLGLGSDVHLWPCAQLAPHDPDPELGSHELALLILELGALGFYPAGICRSAAQLLLVPLNQHSGSTLQRRDARAQVSPHWGSLCSAPSRRALPVPPWHSNARRGF